MTDGLPDDFTFGWFDGMSKVPIPHMPGDEHSGGAGIPDPQASQQIDVSVDLQTGRISLTPETLEQLLNEFVLEEDMLYHCIEVLLEIIDHAGAADYRTDAIEAVRTYFNARRKP